MRIPSHVIVCLYSLRWCMIHNYRNYVFFNGFTFNSFFHLRNKLEQGRWQFESAVIQNWTSQHLFIQAKAFIDNIKPLYLYTYTICIELHDARYYCKLKRLSNIFYMHTLRQHNTFTREFYKIMCSYVLWFKLNSLRIIIV